MFGASCGQNSGVGAWDRFLWFRQSLPFLPLCLFSSLTPGSSSNVPLAAVSSFQSTLQRSPASLVCCRAARLLPVHPCPLPPCSTPWAHAWRQAATFPLPVCASALLHPEPSPFSATEPGCSALLPAAPRSCISGSNPLFLFLPSPLPCAGSIQYRAPWQPAALCLSWSTLRGAKTPWAAPKTTAMTTMSASACQGHAAVPSSLPSQERGESSHAQGKAFPSPAVGAGTAIRRVQRSKPYSCSIRVQ